MTVRSFTLTPRRMRRIYPSARPASPRLCKQHIERFCRGSAPAVYAGLNNHNARLIVCGSGSGGGCCGCASVSPTRGRKQHARPTLCARLVVGLHCFFLGAFQLFSRYSTRKTPPGPSSDHPPISLSPRSSPDRSPVYRLYFSSLLRILFLIISSFPALSFSISSLQMNLHDLSF